MKKLLTVLMLSASLAACVATPPTTPQETKITALETAQKERSDLLADPSVYADKQRSSQLLAEFREQQPELERLTARWEQAISELESLTAADGGETT